MRRILIVVMLFFFASFPIGKSEETELKSKLFERQSKHTSEIKSLRHMKAEVPSMDWSAEIDVHVMSGKNQFVYEIMRQTGSSKVLSRMKDVIEGEAKGVRNGSFSKNSFVEQNYFFSPAEELFSGLWKVQINPKRKDEFLISGFLALKEDGSLHSSEGKLAKNPSRWIRSASLAIEYKEFQGVDLPVKIDSTAKVWFLGQAILSINYDYLSINGDVATR